MRLFPEPRTAVSTASTWDRHTTPPGGEGALRALTRRAAEARPGIRRLTPNETLARVLRERRGLGYGPSSC